MTDFAVQGVGRAVGQQVGAWIGGLAGSLVGPEGTVIGAMVGRYAGGYAGAAGAEWVWQHMSKADESADKKDAVKQDDQTAPARRAIPATNLMRRSIEPCASCKNATMVWWSINIQCNRESSPQAQALDKVI